MLVKGATAIAASPSRQLMRQLSQTFLSPIQYFAFIDGLKRNKSFSFKV